MYKKDYFSPGLIYRCLILFCFLGFNELYFVKIISNYLQFIEWFVHILTPFKGTVKEK